MNLYFRFFWVVFSSLYRKKISLFDTCITSFRCMPNDLDLLLHMNNGRYFTLMDLGRYDQVERAGFRKKFSKAGVYPVVGAETIRFYKSLALFQKFNIETKIMGWDDKSFVLRQRFVVGKNDVYAEAFIRARFLKRSGGALTTPEVLALAGESTQSPTLDPWLAEWVRVQSLKPNFAD